MNITSGRLRNILHEGCTDSEKWEIAKDLLEYRTGLPAKWQEDSSLETWFPLTAEELRNWRTWGIIEIAVRNPNVASYMQEWEKRAKEAEIENDKLRALLAQGKGDCVYCGLPAADIAKCPHGFPGCARMDDIVNKHETAVEMENTNLRVDVLNLRDALKSLTDKLEANDGRKPEPAE